MRSSWDASAMKRRSRSSEAWRSSKAPSIWWSMPLSASPSRPASVDGGPTSTRRERSPSAMASAVAVILSIGRSPSRITQNATSASTSSTAAVAATSTAIIRLSVASASRSDTATTARLPSLRCCTATR